MLQKFSKWGQSPSAVRRPGVGPAVLKHDTGCPTRGRFTGGPLRTLPFVVLTEKKRVEKLRYMHRNPVQRGLVRKPEEWLWSSFRHYAYGEAGPVVVNEIRRAELHIRKIS